MEGEEFKEEELRKSSLPTSCKGNASFLGSTLKLNVTRRLRLRLPPSGRGEAVANGKPSLYAKPRDAFCDSNPSPICMNHFRHYR